MSSSSRVATKLAGTCNDSSREQSAGGLKDHFRKNQSHQKSAVEDSYRMPTHFDVTTAKAGVYQGPRLHQASAELLNEMLRANQVDNHVYFSETGGFHNHRVHHLLAAYALGATPQELQLAHDTMESTQRPRFPIDESRINEMYDTKGFKSMLGDERDYHNYLAFFWQKFEKDGWKPVVAEYLFSGTEVADDLFTRLFTGMDNEFMTLQVHGTLKRLLLTFEKGIWHNLILVGYGIEFEQPGILAEGLAGACIHSNAFRGYLFECESLAKTPHAQCKSLVELLREVRNDPLLCDKDHWKGGNSFAYDDDIVGNAPAGMAKLASQWRVEKPDDLTYRTAELINVNAFIAGAAQRPDKAVKIDFIFVHHINASIFFSSFLQQDWIGTTAKIRLLEWYARLNLLFYAASLGPELLADEIVDYNPVKPGSTWDSIIQRALSLPDDGHLPKLIRALAHGERVCRPLEEDDKRKEIPMLPMKGRMWLQVANMAIDSAEAELDIIKRWVRGAGSDEAWAEVPDRRA